MLPPADARTLFAISRIMLPKDTARLGTLSDTARVSLEAAFWGVADPSRLIAGNLSLDREGEPGQGMAYSTRDPDHRLNAPAQAHSIIPADIMHFSRWARARGLVEQDPEALWSDGGTYYRRRDFAAYLATALEEHSHWSATGSTITHVRDRAVAARPTESGKVLKLASGAEIQTRMVFLATGNPALRLPPPSPGPGLKIPGSSKIPSSPDVWPRSIQPRGS